MSDTDTIVTGGSGFVGLAVVEQLLLRGESVAIADVIPPPEEFVAHAGTLGGRLAFHPLDVQQGPAVAQLLERLAPRTVIHAAAVTSDAARERRDPDLVVRTNLMGTLNLLEAVRQGPGCRLVHLSTSGVYGDIANRRGFHASAIDEEVPPDPRTLYAVSKAAAELTVRRYAELFGLDAVCARIGICWGPWEYDTGLRDPFSAPLQLLRTAARRGQAALARDAIKDWAYSRDVGRAVVAIKDAGQTPSQVYNVGADAVWPISAWAERLRDAFPGFAFALPEPASPTIELYGPKDRPPLSVERLKSEIGFAFAYDREAAFADYLDWAGRFACWKSGEAR